MIKFNENIFVENCIIEFCILPGYSSKKLLDAIKTDIDIVYVDTRGSLSALLEYQKSKESKQEIESHENIFRIFNFQDFLNCCEILRTKRKKLCIFDSLPGLVDTIKEFDLLYTIYNSLWELIYHNDFTFMVTNHYKITETFYVPRLGNLWMLNVTYRILLKFVDGEKGYEIVQNPTEKRFLS